MGEAFNSGNAAGCAACYADTTVMTADIPAVTKEMAPLCYYDPVVLHVKEDIEKFWSNMINKVKLTDMKAYEGIDGEFPMTICVIDDNTALVRSNWRMNITGGHIHSQYMQRESKEKGWVVGMDFFAIYEKHL